MSDESPANVPGVQENIRTYKVFCAQKSDLRRFSLPYPISFADLKNYISNLYFPMGGIDISLKYQDNENDFVTLCTDAELQDAWQLIGDNSLLRMTMDPVTSPSLQSPAMSPLTPSFVPRSYHHDTNRGGWNEGRRSWRDRKIEKAQRHHEKELYYQERKQNKSHRLRARFLRDVTIPKKSKLLPNVPFVKTWRFRNEGTTAWPENCQLVFVDKFDSSLMGALDRHPLSRVVHPDEEIDITLNMVSPSTLGKHSSFWRLVDGSTGARFGQRACVKIVVVDKIESSSDSSLSGSGSEIEEGYQMILQNFEQMGFSDSKRNLKVLKNCGGDMEMAVKILASEQFEKENRKC